MRNHLLYSSHHKEGVRKMMTILCIVGLFGAYKKFGDEKHPVELTLRGFSMACMVLFPFLT